MRRFRGTAPVCVLPQIESFSISFLNFAHSAAAKSWYGFFSAADRAFHCSPSSFETMTGCAPGSAVRLALRK